MSDTAEPEGEPEDTPGEATQEQLRADRDFSGEMNEQELQELVSGLQTNILILGAGGAGNNTLERLYREGIDGVEMLAVNTDAQHLHSRLDDEVRHRERL